jgi:hypothetical protein
MKRIIGNEPVQKLSTASRLRCLAFATRVVSDQAVLMTAAQQFEDLVYILDKIVKKSYLRTGKHEDCQVHPELIADARQRLAYLNEGKNVTADTLKKLNQLFTEMFPDEPLFHGGDGRDAHPAVVAMRNLILEGK